MSRAPEPITRRAALICSQTSTTKPTQNFVNMERSGVQAGTAGMSSAFRSGNTETFRRSNQLRHSNERTAEAELQLLVPSGLRAPDRPTLLTLWTTVIMRQSDAGVQLPAMFLGIRGQKGRKEQITRQQSKMFIQNLENGNKEDKTWTEERHQRQRRQRLDRRTETQVTQVTQARLIETEGRRADTQGGGTAGSPEAELQSEAGPCVGSCLMSTSSYCGTVAADVTRPGVYITERLRLSGEDVSSPRTPSLTRPYSCSGDPSEEGSEPPAEV